MVCRVYGYYCGGDFSLCEYFSCSLNIVRRLRTVGVEEVMVG